jgi:DNA-binding transcriptional MerR regulator
LKVGALASRTGLTIRTLHHYDEIGLLSPASRTPSGHRLYDVRDVARLQQIQALRSLGLSLDEIGETLRSGRYSARDIVRLHIDRLELQIAQHQQVVSRLSRLADHLDNESTLSMDELCQVIGATHTMERYFTPTQLAAMHARGATLGAAQVRAMQAEWAELIPAMRAHWTRGTPSTDRDVQRLAQRWRELLQLFTQGDPEIAQRLRAMAVGEPADGMPEVGLMEYVGKA